MPSRPDFPVNRCLFGDCRDVLRGVPDGLVQCVVTSPPYWGLRDYGHDDQIGLETTPVEYVEQIVAVFREVWRVLADDGSLWLNLGDSYVASSQSNRGRGKATPALNGNGTPHKPAGWENPTRRAVPSGLKPKDMMGIPWRVAFALQADGWFLRSDVIWSKPNPMPESVTDRPTKAHEYVFLMTKARRYYYDIDALREPHKMRPQRRPNGHKRRRPGPLMPEHTWAGTARDEPGVDGNPLGRNARTVWEIPPEQYHGAHYAVMPSRLASRCILVSSRPGDVVLDPFFGSGTVGAVAERHGRKWLGIELNENYAGIIRERTAQTGLGI